MNKSKLLLAVLLVVAVGLFIAFDLGRFVSLDYLKAQGVKAPGPEFVEVEGFWIPAGSAPRASRLPHALSLPAAP